MKYIQKAGCPRPYARWCAAVAGTDKADWREVPARQKETLLAALISEQGALCAYTMRRIGPTSAHVEHIKPQSRCRADRPGSDLDYDNLVACSPRKGMQGPYRYGAQKKGNWWENDGADFVSPLRPECEHRFRFGLDGRIVAVGKNSAAMTTIRVLGLDDGGLTEARKRVIEECLYGVKGDEPRSRASAERERDIICARGGQSQFFEFCIAIKSALGEYLVLLRRIAKRQRAARRKRGRK